MVLLLALVIASCNNEETPTVEEPTNLDPLEATLLMPANSQSCVDGDSAINDQISIVFSWTAAANADRYELVLKKDGDDLITEFSLDTTQITIDLDKESSYSWYVISKSDTTTNTTPSEEWSFTTIGEELSFRYTPSPAELISPTNGFNFKDVTTVNLDWAIIGFGADFDRQEIFVDTSLPVSLTNGTVVSPQVGNLNINVSAGNVYYWRVKTYDVNGLSALSSVFSFRVD
ncbi:MAG: hypothetical protein AAF617_04740 [Bacteroidota bacterium]